jgi:uncharacterized protein YjbI with pentapeptide repeats
MANKCMCQPASRPPAFQLVPFQSVLAVLFGADLSHTDLTHSRFTDANLSHSNLTCANLWHANFTSADLTGANFTNATMYGTILADADLSSVKGLETVRYAGPSEVSISTIYKSNPSVCPSRVASRPRSRRHSLRLAASASRIRFNKSSRNPFLRARRTRNEGNSCGILREKLPS